MSIISPELKTIGSLNLGIVLNRYFKIVNSFDNEEHSNSAIVPGANSGTYEPTPERVNFGTSHYAKSSSNPLTQAYGPLKIQSNFNSSPIANYT